MFDRLALFSRNQATLRDLAAAGERAGLDVLTLTGDPAQLARIAGPSVALRAPGGLVAAAVEAGASGPSMPWFVALPIAITGRRWHRLSQQQARAPITRDGPWFVILADAKVPAFPARRYCTLAEFDQVATPVSAGPGLELLATNGWFDIASEYRLFTEGRTILTCSPYSIEDEPCRPRYTHRASFHHEAVEYLSAVLQAMPENSVPSAAAMDVARLVNGRFVLLEANQSWSAGPYDCDPDAVLRSVLAANR